ncbi:gallinacin-3 isoform X2 [Gallus gallus]|nr:gallinacin-3 isoform X2 [Gallus gallus]
MSHPQQWYKSVIFSAKPYSLTVRSPIHKGFLSGVFVFKHQGVHQPREDLLQASAMKILYLLIPFFLLFLQGAAGTATQCRIRGGFCRVGSCRFPHIAIGKCATFISCCGRAYEVDALNSVRTSPWLLAPGNNPH